MWTTNQLNDFFLIGNIAKRRVNYVTYVYQHKYIYLKNRSSETYLKS